MKSILFHFYFGLLGPIWVAFLGPSLLPALRAEQNLAGFCFPSSTDLNQVKSTLGPLLLKGEEVHLRPSLHCIEIPLSPGRIELFNVFLRQRFTLSRTYPQLSESADTFQQRENCELVLLQQTEGLAEKNDVGLNPWGPKAKVKQENHNSQSENQSFLLLQSGATGRLQVDGTSVNVLCQHLSPQRYQIQLSLFEFRPSTSVSKSQSPSPAQYETQQVATTVTLNKGDNLNIGEIVQNLRNKDQEISLSKGIQWGREKGHRTTKYFLRIK